MQYVDASAEENSETLLQLPCLRTATVSNSWRERPYRDLILPVLQTHCHRRALGFWKNLLVQIIHSIEEARVDLDLCL